MLDKILSLDTELLFLNGLGSERFDSLANNYATTLLDFSFPSVFIYKKLGIKQPCILS
jgi:hypothetical protein